MATSCTPKTVFEGQAGSIRIAIDEKGRISKLVDTSTEKDYICDDQSYLIRCLRYNADSILTKPSKASLNSDGNIQLDYPNGIKIVVSIVPKYNYFRMEIIDAEPLSEINLITWGPYFTNMQGQAGRWLGLARSDDFTIGLLGLEPNTDAPTNLGQVASYTKDGTALQLVSFDHTRGIFRGNESGNLSTRTRITDENVKEFANGDPLRHSKPIDVTVKNSAIALFGSKSGKDNELDEIEKIELEEDLPHPMINGKWNKRTKEGQKLFLWTGYDAHSFLPHLDMAKQMNARIICCTNFFSNWGHFDIDPKKYPGGTAQMREDSETARKEGIGTTLYTLTTFLKPINMPEPYVSPVPDDRLQTWRASAILRNDITSADTTFRLINSKDVLETLQAARNKVLRIDNEMIEIKSFKEDGNDIVVSGCSRGQFYTSAEDHKGNSPVKLMYVAGYHNFFPGTLDLSLELSDNIAKDLLEADTENLVLDGFESCLETGYGPYTCNMFAKNIYDKCISQDKETLVTGSRLTQYSWHIYSQESWGEHDRAHGTRGSMLDYRLDRQMRLTSSLMPNKMGQYYPELATLSDVEWLLGLAAGWDSGVDFSVNIETFKKNNPQSKEILTAINNWAEAVEEDALTEKQKMELRQTDREYHLTKDKDGKWTIEFVGYWRNENVKTLPSSVMKATNVEGGEVRPCSIDWSWTHNPATYDEIALSDDMVHESGSNTSKWTVYFPDYTDPQNAWFPYQMRHFQFVLRLPKDAPCSISDIHIDVNGQPIDIPVTLNPGEYISMPHAIPLVCVYDENNQLLSEKRLRGDVPTLNKGTTAEVALSYKSEKEDEKPSLIMNARFQNGYYAQNY